MNITRGLLYAILISGASTCCSAGDLAAYRLRAFGTDAQGQAFQSNSTCFSVGELASGGSLLVSARHCFTDADRAQVRIGDRWHAVRKITEDRAADLVAIEIDSADTQELCLGEATPGIAVDLLGYGSEYNGGKKEPLRGRLVTVEQMVGIGGHHAVRGDSGGPVVDVAGRVVGVCSEVQWVATASRSDWAGQDAKTNIVPVAEVKRFLTQYYQQSCGPSVCTIWMEGGVQGYRPRADRTTRTKTRKQTSCQCRKCVDSSHNTTSNRAGRLDAQSGWAAACRGIDRHQSTRNRGRHLWCSHNGPRSIQRQSCGTK